MLRISVYSKPEGRSVLSWPPKLSPSTEHCWWKELLWIQQLHYNDVIMCAMASQITSLAIIYWTVYSGADQRKHHSSASLAFVRRIHWWLVNSPHKWPVMRKMFPFGDVIMSLPKKLLVVGARSSEIYPQGHCKVDWLSVQTRSHNLQNEVYSPEQFDTFRSIKNGLHFVGEIFKLTSSNEYCRVFIQIALKFLPRGQIKNNLVLL